MKKEKLKFEIDIHNKYWPEWENMYYTHARTNGSTITHYNYTNYFSPLITGLKVHPNKKKY